MPKDRKQILLPTDHHLLVTLRATTYCRVVLGPGALAATSFDAACHRRDDHRHARFAQAVVTDQTCCITPFRLTTIYLSRFARSLLAVWSSSLELWQPCCASSVSSTSANEMGKGVVIPSTVYLIRQTAIYEDAIKHSIYVVIVSADLLRFAQPHSLGCGCSGTSTHWYSPPSCTTSS